MLLNLLVERVQEEWDPFLMSLWEPLCEPIEQREVAVAIAQKRLESTPWDTWDTETRERHVERIAFLVVHGWSGPISIDVGVPGLGYNHFSVEDGNHRLAAAIYRKDFRILAECAGQESVMRWFAGEGEDADPCP